MQRHASSAHENVEPMSIGFYCSSTTLSFSSLSSMTSCESSPDLNSSCKIFLDFPSDCASFGNCLPPNKIKIIAKITISSKNPILIV